MTDSAPSAVPAFPEPDAGPLMIEGYQCMSCHSLVYSRAERDRRRCACGQTHVDGGPLNPRLTRNTLASTPKVRFVSPAPLNHLHNDWNYGYDRHRVRHFPLDHFQYVGNDMFPVRARRTHKRGGEEQLFEAKLTLVPPRNVPEHAPTVMDARSPGVARVMVWAHHGDVWGRIAYTVSNVTDEVDRIILSQEVGRMKLCSIEALRELDNGVKQLREFRSAWEAILGRYLGESRNWFTKPVPVEELVWMDILSHKSSRTANSYTRNLEAKRRMGKHIPSISKAKAKPKAKPEAKAARKTKKARINR